MLYFLQPSQLCRLLEILITQKPILFPNTLHMQAPVKELRIVLSVDNLDEIIRFYRDTVGLKTSKEWNETTGRGIILEAGKASLELIDKRHAGFIDSIETGKRVSGPVRLALHVGDHLPEATAALIAGGAREVASPVKAPWSDVARIETPDGMQVTLFATSTLD
jgi:catechol 2,3-dioxygenase-like lactoylglutathione lyase family enzyme